MTDKDRRPNPLVSVAVVAWSLLLCLLPVALAVALVRWMMG